MARIEEPLINELLLVGSALGSIETITTEDGSLIERFIRGENCLEWLQDLQRALRRDDDYERAVAVKLGSWKVVETKLLPLLLECRDDVELVVTLTKIFVMLTMPLHPTVKSWLLLEVDSKGHEDPDTRDDKLRRRSAAQAQVANLLQMKRAFVNPEVIAVLVATLEEPLANAGTRMGRSEDDTLIIELMLTLLRNLLCIEEEGALMGVSEGAACRLHNELLVILEQEFALEVVLLLCQGVQSRDNSSWNLLLMEVVFHLVRGQDPAHVATAAIAEHTSGRRADKGAEAEDDSLPLSALRSSSSSSAAGLSLQKDELSRHALMQRSASGSRHSRFGPQLKLSGPGGLTRVVAKPCYRGGSLLDALPQATRKRNRRNAIFLTGGGGSAGDYEGTNGVAAGEAKAAQDPIAARAHACLSRLVEAFLAGAYEPFVRSLKDEFRRDSSRLEAEDRTVFFRITRFFLAFHRLVETQVRKQQQQARSSSSSSSSVSAGLSTLRSLCGGEWRSSLVQSMDVLSFNLVLSTMDSLMAEQGHRQLVHALALYKEMIHFLSALAHSHEPAHVTIALGLQYKLFYAPEPVDKLSRILGSWKPGLFPRSYLADIVDLTHTQLLLLESNTKAVHQAEEAMREKKKEGSSSSRTEAEEERGRQLLDIAQGFDFERYLAGLCTNQVVRMLTYLLEQYKANSPTTNRQILHFFQRMRNHDLDSTRGGKKKASASSDPFIVDEDEDEARKAIASQKKSLEPMLFHVPLLLVLHRILEDRALASPTSPMHDLVRFAKSLVRHLGEAARWNPLVLVEALFQHPFPHHWCSNFHQAYVSADHASTIARASKTRQEDDDEDYNGEDEEEEDDDEEEEEAEEAAAAAAKEALGGARTGALAGGKKKRPKKKKKKKKAADKPPADSGSSSSEEEEEWDGMVLNTRRAGDSDDDDSSGAEGGKKKGGSKRKKGSGGDEKTKRRSVKWELEEDSALRKHYPVYKGTASCLEALAKLAPLARKDRSTLQVKRRLQFLKIWEKPSKAGAAKPPPPTPAKDSGSDSDLSSISSSSSSSSSSSGRAKKKTKPLPAATPDDQDASQEEATGATQAPGQQQQEGGTSEAAGAAPTSSATPGAAKKKKRLRKKEESESSSSDDSLDII